MKQIYLFLLVSFAFGVSGQDQPMVFNGKGLGFSTKDSAYSVSIRFRIQNRALMNTVSDEDLSPESFEARVRRCRLMFKGHAVSPRISYYLQLSFSRGDMDWTVEDQSSQNVSPNVVRDAVLYYRAASNVQFGFGQTKLPGNRQRVNSSGALQFYDRSLVNSHFTTDRDFGFFSVVTLPGKSNNTITRIKAAVSTGEGRNSNKSNVGLAYTGRIEFLPFGVFKDDGDYFEGDLVREEKPKLSIAGGYMLNDLAVRTGGQLGDDLHGEKSFQLYMLDMIFKYKGLCFASEYLMRSAENPYVRGDDGVTRNINTGDGINNQLSYCFPSKWEFAIRQTLISPHRDVLRDFNQQEQYGAGVTKYLNNHKVKCQLNIMYNRARNLFLNKDLPSFYTAVFQVELGI